MKIRNMILIGVCIALGGCARISDDQVRSALDGAFFPETDQDQEMVSNALTSVAGGAPDIGILELQLGTNNLSFFLLTLKTDSSLMQSEVYDFEWQDADLEAIVEKFSRTGSLVTSENVTDLTYRMVGPRTVEGGFTLRTSFSVEARLLFRAVSKGGNLEVTRLVARRRDSDDVDNGFPMVTR